MGMSMGNAPHKHKSKPQYNDDKTGACDGLTFKYGKSAHPIVTKAHGMASKSQICGKYGSGITPTIPTKSIGVMP